MAFTRVFVYKHFRGKRHTAERAICSFAPNDPIFHGYIVMQRYDLRLSFV